MRAAAHGLRLGYHNHDFELSSLIGGRPALEVLADQLDPAAPLEVDTYWAAVGGQYVPELLGRLGDRVRYLHVKDGPVTKDDAMTAVGGGTMPVAEILAARPSVEWNVVELDACATDMMEAVGDSITWLTSHGLAAQSAPPAPRPGEPRPPAPPGRKRELTVPAPLGVAVVGCGTISDEYLRNLTAFPDLQVVFCADLDLERAKGQAAAYGVPAAGTLAQALEHDGVQLVVNLTLPGSHAEVAAAAIAAGKHVWNEVAAVGRQALTSRVIGSGPKAGTTFAVEVPTHVGALVEYTGGAAASLLFSFDSPLPRHGFVEITGPRRRWPSPTRTGSPGTSGFTVAAATAGRRSGLRFGRARPRGAGHGARPVAGQPHRASASWRCTSWR